MTISPVPTERKNEVFDRILGRKGDEVRLDPAIATVEKVLAERLQEAFQKREFEAVFSFEESRQDTAANLLTGDDAASGLIGDQADPSAYVVMPFTAIGILSDMMLGGDPEFAAAEEPRPPTDLERQLVAKFCGIVGEALKATLDSKEQPGFLRLAMSGEEMRESESETPVVVFNVKYGFGPAESTLSLAITHYALLKMARHERVRVRRPKGEQPPAQHKGAFAVNVSISGSVAAQSLTLGDIANLRPGSVVPLAGGAEGGIRLKVKGRPLYECSLGRQGTNFALYLQRPHKAMDEVLTGIGMSLSDGEHEDDDYE